MGMINKGLLLEKKFYIEIRETALKDAYPIMGDSIKMTPTLFCDP
ncbi:hypothetical protein ID0181_10910 [Helicobacter pylori]